MIGIVGDRIYRPFLAKLLEDESKQVLVQAIFAAGQLGDTSFTAELTRYSADGDSTVKAHAIVALSQIGSPAAATQLIYILADSLEKPHFRALAAESMVRLGDRTSFGALFARAGDKNRLIREKVFYALSRRADKDALPIYLLGLADSVRQIRIFSLSALAKVGDASVIPQIKRRLSETDWRVKYYCLQAAGKLNAQVLIPQVVAMAGAREHPYVRQAAIKALGEIGGAEAIDRLTMELSDADPNLCNEALLALAKLRKDDVFSQIENFATAENSSSRAAAATACGYLTGDSRWNLLSSLAQDPIAVVRGAAFEILTTASPDTMRIRYINQALGDSDIVPVYLACSQIFGGRMTDLLPFVVRMYLYSAKPDIRTTILDCMLEYGDSLRQQTYLVPLIKSAVEDTNNAIRIRARKIAPLLGLEVVDTGNQYRTSISAATYSSIYNFKGTNPIAEIITSKGTIRIELLRKFARKTVANFIKLAKSGFYDKKSWHRVVPDFVIQDGDPRGDGWGGPGYEIRCEYNDLPYNTGSVGMATSGKDTGGSQYFICQSPQPHLNGRYTQFGRVLSGMDVVTQIEVGDMIQTIKIIQPREKH